MKTFAGIYIFNGHARRLSFEANDAEEALSIGLKWNVGLEPESVLQAAPSTALPIPDVYDFATAARLLGNVSRSTIYKWLVLGRLVRIPKSRKILITRQSVELLAKTV